MNRYLLVLPILFFIGTNFLAKGYSQQRYIRNNQNRKMVKWNKDNQTNSIQSEIPTGYIQLKGTDLYYSKKIGGIYVGSVSVGSIDLIGKYGDRYYSSTYGDYGYVVAMQVNDNEASFVDCKNGSMLNGVSFRADIEAQGEMAKVYYTVKNTNDTEVSICLGVYDDVYVGDNIAAAITRKKSTIGDTYGISLSDGGGAQLCVLFGSGLTGVTGVDDYWFGSYNLNTDAYSMACHYSSGENYLIENGNYDCGIGWGWKNHIIKAGETVVFSYLIAIGDVTLEPGSSFEVTPDDPDGWNDLSRPHRLTLNGTYESPAGLEGFIDYAVEDSEEWTVLTDTLASGEEFVDSLTAMFNPEKPIHEIKFRTRDLVGNTTKLPSIIYKDVSFYTITGIEEKTYTGDSLFQNNIMCELAEGQYELKKYRDNVNAGMASFNIEGVFPYTIGRKTYTFTINPQPLSGELKLSKTAFIFNGQPFTPDWQFSNISYANLEYDKDYTLIWSNNTLPGTGTLTVTGKNNYTSSLSAKISIEKALLIDSLYKLTLPPEDITYDAKSHGASITKSEGVGDATISYMKAGDTEASTTKPVDAGSYTIYLEFADGSLYCGKERIQVGTFTIYDFNAEEWAILQTVLPQLTGMGWSQPWDVSQGIKNISTLYGLNIEKGHVTGLNLSGQNLTGTFPYSILSLPQLQYLNLSNNNLSGDIGNSAHDFALQHLDFVSSVKELNISGNKLYGNITTFTNLFPSLISLNASNNCLEDVSPMISSSVTTLDLSKQVISRVVPLHLANLSEDYISMNVPSILLYDHANQSFTKDLEMLCTTQDKSWEMTIKCQNGHFSIPYVSEQNTYYGQSGDILNVAIQNKNSANEISTFPVALSFDEGDSNFDGQVNVLDLQTTLNYMFEEYTNKPYNFTASNLWKDEVINVQDAVSLVNLLLNTDVQQTAYDYNLARLDIASPLATDASIYIINGELRVNSSVPISAFDIVVSTKQKCKIAEELSKAGFTCSVKQNGAQVHIVGYSLSGNELPVGQNVLCKLNDGFVTHAMMADKDANAIRTSTYGTTTNILPTFSDTVSRKEVYRISLGYNHSIIIDANGKKFIVKNKH